MLQAGVPGAMAVLVVYGLEPVEVHHRQRRRPSPPFGPREVLGEALFPGPAVEEPREVVVCGQLPEGAQGRVQDLEVFDQPARHPLHDRQVALPEPRVGLVAHAAQRPVEAPV